MQALGTTTKAGKAIGEIGAWKAVSLEARDAGVADKLALGGGRESRGTAQAAEPNTAVTVNDVASLVGPPESDAIVAHRALRLADARLRVVGEHRHVVRRRRPPLGGSERGGGVGRVQPGGEGGAAPAAVNLAAVSARRPDAAEEGRREGQAAPGGVRLLREGRDCGGGGGGRGEKGLHGRGGGGDGEADGEEDRKKGLERGGHRKGDFGVGLVWERVKLINGCVCVFYWRRIEESE